MQEIRDMEKEARRHRLLERQVQSLTEALATREATKPITIMLDPKQMSPADLLTLATRDNKVKIHYVVGFCFMPDTPSKHNQFQGHEVVLIRKNKPDWQRGKLNGVGGKVEPGESPRAAMQREFEEEAGLLITAWYEVVDMIFDDCVVHVFQARLGVTRNPVSKTDEQIEVWNVRDLLPYRNKIDNLNWLIPMALCCAPPHSVPKIFFS